MVLSYNNARNLLSNVRRIAAKVELYNGSTLVDTFTYEDQLNSFAVDRVGEDSKFFGFAVGQKANIKLQDRYKELEITTAHHFRIYLATTGAEWINPFPYFYVSEVHRDEATNELSITAYDLLYEAQKHLVSELAIDAPYTVRDFAQACADIMGLNLSFMGFMEDDSAGLALSYATGANFEGTESVRSAIVAIAEATQTVCYIFQNTLTFKMLDKAITADLAFIISKEQYFDLKTSDNRRLSIITHATELGDNVSASLTVTGSTQYVRDNPFWDLREDIGDIVDNSLATIGGITIQELEINWRGYFLLEIGDPFAVQVDEGYTNVCYLLNDKIEYNGTLSQKTQWKYVDSAATASNPTTLGEVLNQTFARVDKANKQIDIVASETTAHSEAIAGLLINTENIVASVKQVQDTSSDAIEDINNELGVLTNRVDATLTAEEIAFNIETALENGAGKVITKTGFTFDEDGLTVEKSDSEMKTQITEDGMKVFKNGEEVLTANNVGVNAVNLHATTYLIVGDNSRFENYGRNRTGCFWIGG